MKKILTLMLFALLALPSLAQDDEQEIPPADPKANEKIQALRVAYITERLGLTSEEAEKFWPIYREFAEKRRSIRQDFKMAKKDGTSEKDLLDLELKTKQKELDLEKDYSGRLQKVVSAQKLMSLRQAERDFTKLILRQIQQRQMQQERKQQLRERQQQRLQERNN